MRDALGKCEVIERRMQFQNLAIDFDHFVDVPSVPGVPNTEQANIVGSQLRMLQPGAPEEVAATDAEAADTWRSSGDGGWHFSAEFRGGPLVGIEHQHPWVAKG